MSWGHSNINIIYNFDHGWEQHIASNMFWNPTSTVSKQGLHRSGTLRPIVWKGIHSTWSKNQHQNPNHSKSYPVDLNVWETSETLIKKKANGHFEGSETCINGGILLTSASWNFRLIGSRSSGLTWQMLWRCGFSSTFSTSGRSSVRGFVCWGCWEGAGFWFGFWLCWVIGFHPFHLIDMRIY